MFIFRAYYKLEMQSENTLTTLTIIHSSLVMGLFVFCGFAYWQKQSFNTAIDSADFFIYIVPLAAAIGYFASKFIFQNLIRNIDRNDGLENKLSRYQVACLIKYALIEATACLALVAYYLNGNALHLVVGLCLIAYLISQRPTQKRVQNDIKFTRDEQQQLDS